MRNKAQTSTSERQKIVKEGYEDPMVKIVMSFQSLQKSLEKELRKFGQIGKEMVSLSDDIGLDSGSWEELSPDLKTDEAISFDGLHFDDTRQGGFHGRPTHVIKLNEELRVPESNPKEVSAGITPQESQGFALESTSSRHGYLKKVLLESPEDKCAHMEMELKLEDLFTQKIEAEVEYLVVARANQRLNVARVDQLSLLEEQKCLANEQIQILHRLGDAESKSIVLKSQMLGLEASCAELLSTEQVLIMQTRVCVRTLYFFAQFLLLLADLLAAVSSIVSSCTHINLERNNILLPIFARVEMDVHMVSFLLFCLLSSITQLKKLASTFFDPLIEEISFNIIDEIQLIFL